MPLGDHLPTAFLMESGRPVLLRHPAGFVFTHRHFVDFKQVGQDGGVAFRESGQAKVDVLFHHHVGVVIATGGSLGSGHYHTSRVELEGFLGAPSQMPEVRGNQRNARAPFRQLLQFTEAHNRVDLLRLRHWDAPVVEAQNGVVDLPVPLEF